MKYTKGSQETGWGDVTVIVESEYWECLVCGNRTFESDEVKRLQDIAQKAAELATI